MATIGDRARALLADHPGGLTARAVAGHLGVSHATASCALARLFWQRWVDRRLEDGPHSTGVPYVYTLHALASDQAAVQD